MRCPVLTTIATLLALAAPPLAGTASAQFAQGQKAVGAHVGLSGVGAAPAIGIAENWPTPTGSPLAGGSTPGAMANR